MSLLYSRILAKQFTVTTELSPPKGLDLTELLAKADALRGWVDAVNLTESHRARMSMEPKAVGHLLLDHGLEPIVQITARDRNRIAFQADLLGGAALGIENFVFMGGDSPRHGDHPLAKPVFDLNASEMLRAARALCAGQDMNGNSLKGAPQLTVGAVANPAASKLDAEIDNTRLKIASGAQFLQTQAIFDTAALEYFITRVQPGDTAILAGIIPLKSAKMARWLNDNVPGITVPEALIDEMAAATPGDGELAKGIEIAGRLIHAARAVCGGVHVMALGWEQHVPAILASGGVGHR